MRHVKRCMIGAVAAFAIMGFAACGSDTEEYTPPESVETPAPAPTPIPVPTATPRPAQPTMPQPIAPIAPLPGEVDEFDFIPLFLPENPLNLEIYRNSTISAGVSRSMAVTEDGALWTWGNNQAGALGDGTDTLRLYPVSIMDNIAAVSSGSVHSMAIDENGILWSWGMNGTDRGAGVPGVVGDGTYNTHRLRPVSILEDIVKIYAERQFSRAISSDGHMWIWGPGSGIESFSVNIGEAFAGGYFTVDNTFFATPRSIFFGTIGAADASEHALVISYDNTLHVWGTNENLTAGVEPDWLLYTEDGEREEPYFPDTPEGQASRDWFERTINAIWSPRAILEDVVDVSAGNLHTLALQSDGTLWAWGSNQHGQIGNGTFDHVYYPVVIMEDVIAISAGDSHSMAITSDGTLWAWGNNQHGRLGNGTTDSSNVPIAIMENIAIVSAGGGHTMAVTTEGALWAWGQNHQGQLGDGTTQNSRVPVHIMDNVRVPR